MRRAVARGRVFPQYFSTDRRYGRLSLKACALFPLMWANADDQGRLPGNPEEIKYAACPNIDHITKADIVELLAELDKNQLIKLYKTSTTEVIQILDWWGVHNKMQWAWPSHYPPQEGWVDHLRYKISATEVFTQNWPPSGESQSSSQVNPQVTRNTTSPKSSPEPSPDFSPDFSPESSPEDPAETTENSPLTTLNNKRKRKRRGRGNSPEDSGEKPSSSSAGFSTDFQIIFDQLVACFKREWGRVPAEHLETIIPREPMARELAQMRDLAKEISAAGGCPLDYIKQAFGEAAGQGKYKEKVSYLRAVLLDWLGIERKRHLET